MSARQKGIEETDLVIERAIDTVLLCSKDICLYIGETIREIKAVDEDAPSEKPSRTKTHRERGHGKWLRVKITKPGFEYY